MSNSNQSDSPGPTDDAVAGARGAPWRLPLLLVVVLVAIVAARTSQQRDRAVKRELRPLPQVTAVAGKNVSLTIDFGDGRRREFDAVAWHSGMTVDDLMTAASRLPDGIRYTVGGDGEMMMLASIDGVENEWRGGRFWLYRVNDASADRSLGVCELQPGDRVLWTFSEKE